MIGFILRGLGFGFPGCEIIAAIAASAIACCAICGIYKCSQFRMRDCACIKRCLKYVGADKFEDFEMVMVVHEATYQCSQAKMHTCVRVLAGSHRVQTDESSKGIFQQPLQIFVEQGTDTVCIELLEATQKKVLAVLKLDTMKEILHPKQRATEKLYTMKQKSKAVLNPRIRLSIHLDSDGAVERGLLSGMEVSQETDLMLRQQLQKVSGRQGNMSEIDVLAQGCNGPLDKFGSWGSAETVYVAVLGPPQAKRYLLGVWKDQHAFKKNEKPKNEVDLLKVLSVQPDPGRSDVFMINFVASDKTKKQLAFRRIDRARDVWVEMLQLLIKAMRDLKERGRAKSPKPGEASEKKK